MAQINVIGYVNQDIVQKQSQEGIAYVSFYLKEYISKSRCHSYQVWAWGNTVSKLQRLNIVKGSHIWVTGSIELVDSIVNGSQEKTKILKIYCSDFGVIRPAQTVDVTARSKTAECTSPGLPVELDGDRNQLPE